MVPPLLFMMCSCVRTHTHNVQDGQIGWVISLSQLRWISHNLFSLNHIAHWSSLHTKNIKQPENHFFQQVTLCSTMKIASLPSIHAWTYCNCSLKDPLLQFPLLLVLLIVVVVGFFNSLFTLHFVDLWIHADSIWLMKIWTLSQDQQPVSLLFRRHLYNESRMSNFSCK